MSYTSLQFLIFVVVLLFVYYIVPKKYRWEILLIGNLVCYYLMSGWLLLFVVLASLFSYFGAKLIEKRKEKRKKIFIISLFSVLGFLLVLKYNNFISSLLNPILNIVNLNIPFKKFILPVGISYYTLEMISYLADVYLKKIKPENNFFKLLTFYTYFPKVLEGPISKYRDLSKEIFSEHIFNYESFRKAWVLIGVGFIKKLVIADRCGLFVSNFFLEGHTGLLTIPAIIFYTIQIYFDFSGCIDIVSGVSELFGIKLAENFRQPFFSESIEEFWRRWHITLGLWLKEYVFFPVSLSKTNMKLNKKMRNAKYKHLSKFILVAFPLFFVWFFNGLWHGPTLKYVLYGLYYYLLMMLGILFKPVLEKIVKILRINTEVFSWKLFRIIRTTFIVCIGMLIFRSETITDAFNTLANIRVMDSVKFFELGINIKEFVPLLVMIFAMFFISLAKELKIDVREKLEEQNLVFRWIVYWVIIFSVIIFGVYGRGYDAASFIYGGF